MSRGNIILVGVLALAVGIWLIGRGSEKGKPAGPAPKLFPTFNREAADRIEISGGSGGTSWALVRESSDWWLGVPGGYPVKRAEVDRFLDAVSSLRKENAVGATAGMQADTRTDEKEGRLVRVLKGETPMAEFRVGKNPKQGYHEFFIRRADDGTVYRTQTLLSKERAPVDSPFGGGGASGFDWHSYTGKLSSKWVDPTVWDLGGAEVQEIWITRPDLYEAKIVKQTEDKWDLVEAGKDPVPADADVAQGILSIVRHLRFEDILGPYPAAAKEYGLEKPETTLTLTLKKKVEKPAPKEGEAEKKEDEEEKKEDEYVTFTRIVEVGKKLAVPEFDDYTGETKPVDYYAIHVGPEGDVDKFGHVFLVRDYTAGQIRKDLADLRAKPLEGEEKGHGEEEGDAKPGDEKPAEPGTDGKPAETKPEDQKPADEKPAEGAEKPKDDEKKEGCGCGTGEDEGCGEKEGCGCGPGKDDGAGGQGGG